MARLASNAEFFCIQMARVQEMIYRAIACDNQEDARKDAVSEAEDNYLRTLDDITDRLKAASSSKKPGERRAQEWIDADAIAEEGKRTHDNNAQPDRIADRAKVSSSVAGADSHSTSRSGVT